ncbi:LysE family translocator [Hydrogenophaga sp.]|uniref:LysE family translocator n=1 Tax=Hydrogenophaga sp. TaxID=1904254 RepID=UPI0026032C59|nr:LysE family translocator [Hydrogenophaga sp.]MCW5655481.1 LysE family translocator [Hydrogenophaga sp.]
MTDIQHYGSFIAAILVFQAVPGAGTLAILEATARDGRRAGMAAVLGTLAGDGLFMVAAVAGLAALMQAHAEVFQALQWFGAAYLAWLGVQLLLSRPGTAGAADPARPRSRWRYFRRAFLVSLTNPKVMLFFVAFFPLFLRADASPATLPVMMLHVTVLSLAYQTALVLAGNWVAQRLKAFPGARVAATRLAGVALVGLGAQLASRIR